MNPNPQIVDYAQHLIKMEYMVRVIHDACLSRNFDGAKDIATELVAETRLLVNTLTLMREEQAKTEALRRK